MLDLETKVIRADACHRQALALKGRGLEPDVTLGHHGWGESMFFQGRVAKWQMWLYCKPYHLDSGISVNFFPELSTPDWVIMRFACGCVI